jgi:hypothetical protein
MAGRPIQDGESNWYSSVTSMYIVLIYKVMVQKKMKADDVQAIDMIPFIKEASWYNPEKDIHGTFGRVKQHCKHWSHDQFKKFVEHEESLSTPTLGSSEQAPKIRQDWSPIPEAAEARKVSREIAKRRAPEILKATKDLISGHMIEIGDEINKAARRGDTSTTHEVQYHGACRDEVINRTVHSLTVMLIRLGYAATSQVIPQTSAHELQIRW